MAGLCIRRMPSVRIYTLLFCICFLSDFGASVELKKSVGRIIKKGSSIFDVEEEPDLQKENRELKQRIKLLEREIEELKSNKKQTFMVLWTELLSSFVGML